MNRYINYYSLIFAQSTSYEYQFHKNIPSLFVSIKINCLSLSRASKTVSSGLGKFLVATLYCKWLLQLEQKQKGRRKTTEIRYETGNSYK